jgi:LmbE family N-acetylglucosaminyl deacetylase
MVPFVTSDRILLVAPHPDDETLGAGGLLQRAFASNASVRILFGTNGENNPWAQRYWERRWNIRAADRARWGARRRLEAKRAISVLGGSPDCAVFLDLPDQGITRLLVEGDQALASRFSAEIREWQPTVLVMPIHLDVHPDHSAFSVILLMALDAVGARSIKVWQYLVHEPREPVCCQTVSLGLTLQEVERKRQAIHCYETQVALSRRRFVRLARAQEVYFPRIAREPSPGARPAVTARLQEGFLRLSLRASGRDRSGSEVLLVFRSDAGRAFRWRSRSASSLASPLSGTTSQEAGCARQA